MQGLVVGLDQRPGQPGLPPVRGNGLSVSKGKYFCDDADMKLVNPVTLFQGAADRNLARSLFENPREEATSGSGDRRSKRVRSRRGRRRYWGLLFKGKSLYVRGAAGHVYPNLFLRAKHRTKILQLFHSR